VIAALMSQIGKGPHVYIGYAPADGEFALRLANDLKARGRAAWIDQFGTKPGGLSRELERQRWMVTAKLYLAVLSPDAITPPNSVADEGLELLRHGIRTLPILYKDCEIPMPLRGEPYIDFRGEYAPAFERLLSSIRKKRSVRTSQP
jgi:hypothetical protein